MSICFEARDILKPIVSVSKCKCKPLPRLTLRILKQNLEYFYFMLKQFIKVSRGNGLNLHLETLIISFKISLCSKQMLTTL